MGTHTKAITSMQMSSQNTVPKMLTSFGLRTVADVTSRDIPFSMTDTQSYQAHNNHFHIHHSCKFTVPSADRHALPNSMTTQMKERQTIYTVNVRFTHIGLIVKHEEWRDGDNLGQTKV